MVEGLATRLEGLDDDHTPTAARAGTRQLGLIIGACFFLGLLEDGGTAQELAEASDVGRPGCHWQTIHSGGCGENP